MKLKILTLNISLGLLLILLAIACGAGSSSVASTSISGTGSGSGTSLSKVSGPIDQFGSVYVDGIYFNTDSLTPIIEGSAGNLSELELGMWVTIEGNIDTTDLTGTATNLIFEAHQAGNISSLSAGNTFILNGTTIEVDQSTRYGDNLTLPLQVNDRIQLSGQYLSSGNFYATHIGEHRLPWDRHRLPAELQTQLNDGEFHALQIEVEHERSNGVWESGNIIYDFQQAEATIGGNGRLPLPGEKMSVRGQVLPSGNFQVLSWISRDDRQRNDMVVGSILSVSPMGTPPLISINDISYAIEPYTVFRDESHPRQEHFGFRELRIGDTVELHLSSDGKVLELKKRDS